MDKFEIQEALSVFQQAVDSPRASAVLKFGLANGLQKNTILCLDGKEHSAMNFALRLYCLASQLANGMEDQIREESLQIASILTALGKTDGSTWNYGSELLYHVRCADIQLMREEVGAFLATEKGDKALLEGNALAVVIYAAYLETWFISYPAVAAREEVAGETEQEKLPECTGDSKTAIESLVGFIPAYLGSGAEKATEQFVKYVRKYFMDQEGLPGEQMTPAERAVRTIYWLDRIMKPSSKAQIGRIVLAGIGANIGDTSALPYGHGRTSLYITSAYFGNLLPDEVALAIDAHARNWADSEAASHLVNHSLAAYLHIADTLAKYL